MTVLTTEERPGSIPVVMVGVTRETALAAGETFFNDTPYVVAAALDFTESPSTYQYSPENLAVVLNALHPRPRALITGTAVTEDLLPGLEKAWTEFNQREKVDGVWIALSKTHGSPGPPPPGTGEEMLRQMKEKFGL